MGVPLTWWQNEIVSAALTTRLSGPPDRLGGTVKKNGNMKNNNYIYTCMH